MNKRDDEGNRLCSMCGGLGPFPKLKKSPDGLHSICKACLSKISCEKQRTPEYRDKYLKKMYSMSLEQYEQMFLNQEGVCAMCFEPETYIDSRTGVLFKLAVDHDHACCDGNRSCGECVRGLLCKRCNTILAMFERNMYRILTYLELSLV